jgi:predicted fused transcriptional regulator/phosphomethylpyrimidine kinase
LIREEKITPMKTKENWEPKSNSCEKAVPEVSGNLVYTHPGGEDDCQAVEVTKRQTKKSHLINYYPCMQLILEACS